MRTAFLFIILTDCSFAADDTFVLKTDRLAPYTRSFLGNGYLSVATSQWATKPAESFLSVVYDHGEGDVPRIAVLPAWNEVDVFDGRNWLNQTSLDSGSLRSYRQELNMYEAVLRTEYRWVDGERATSIAVEMFVSRANPHLAVLKLHVTPHYSGPMKVLLPIRAWKPPKRFALAKLDKVPPGLGKGFQQILWYPGHMVVQERSAQGNLLRMISRAEGETATVAQAVALAWPANLPHFNVSSSASVDLATTEIAFEGAAENTYIFYKYAGIVPSLGAPDPAGQAAQVAESAGTRGYDAVFAEHANAWHELWRTDILIDGDPELQRLIHSMLFYVLSCIRDGVEYSIPPMGLSSAGYYGHIFWDADTYFFPSLLVLHPDMAKAIVMFRYKTLEAAKKNARQYGYQGAMYPWEAGSTGEETTPRFAWQNATSEIHVNGDVALAQWQYYLATGDLEWLAHYGYPVIQQTADFWASRVTYRREKGRYEIRNVVSVNESLIGIDNDPYTNGVAATNLRIAVAAARTLGREPDPEWEKVRSNLYVPSEPTLLFAYPLELPLTLEQKRSILTKALQDFQRRRFGVMMGITFNPIVATEIGDIALIDQLLPFTYQQYLRPPFNILTETADSVNVNFLTGAGGFLQQFLYGYSGLRWREDGLRQVYKPLLPSHIKKLKLKNVTIHGKRSDIVVEPERTPIRD